MEFAKELFITVNWLWLTTSQEVKGVDAFFEVYLNKGRKKKVEEKKEKDKEKRNKLKNADWGREEKLV